MADSWVMFPGTVPNMGALGTGRYAETPSESLRSILAAMNEFESSPYGQRMAAQQQAANETLYRRAEAELQLKKDALKLQRAQIALSEGQAKADRWYKGELINLQTQELALKNRQHDDEMAFRNRQQGEQMGLEGLKLGAALSQRPSDLFSSLWYGSATRGNPALSQQIANWANAYGPQTSYSGQYTGPAPTSASVQSLARHLTGQGGAPATGAGQASGNEPAPGSTLDTPGVQATMEAVRQFGMNPGAASAGFVEQMDDTQRAAFESLLGGAGFDPANRLAQYRRSRLPTQLPSAWAA